MQGVVPFPDVNITIVVWQKRSVVQYDLSLDLDIRVLQIDWLATSLFLKLEASVLGNPVQWMYFHVLSFLY